MAVALNEHDLFINDRRSLVNEALDGQLRLRENVARLDGYPAIKVVLRTDWNRDRVALVSGGGSGHEPAHSGYVGEGMLTAAVCGDVFASPSVDAVLAGILSVTGRPGCLLVVKNYTGDRLNFGLAAERARAFGLKVEMIVVDDDIALPDLPQPRGLAGSLFVHKIAGALAADGGTLDEVTRAARDTVASVRSIGMSLDTCTMPGAPKEARIGPGRAELGLGIHGEAGAEQIDFVDASGAMTRVIERLGDGLPEGPLVAMLNNLGGVTPLEMSVLSNELLDSAIGHRIEGMIGPERLMTSLDMRGFSVSVLPVRDDRTRAALHASVTPSAWPGISRTTEVVCRALPDGLAPIEPMPSSHTGRRLLIASCCHLLIDAEASLNKLDAQCGDGDTGSTLATAARALLEALDRLPLSDLTQLYRAIGAEVSHAMGGSSGVLLAIYFTAAGDAAASGRSRSDALIDGLDRVCQVGGAGPGDRTFIDALGPALSALADGSPESLSRAALAARLGADATRDLTHARAGRAAYVSPDRLKGCNDPGAEAVALLFEGLVAATDPPSELRMNSR